jgi:hypothetical protein
MMPVTTFNWFGSMRLRVTPRLSAAFEHPGGPDRLSAMVCVDCGHVSLWVRDLTSLQESYARTEQAGRLGLNDPA